MNSEVCFPARSTVVLPQKRDVISFIGTAVAKYKLRRQVALERKQLDELPEELLKDMGIKREDAVLESRRDPGDLPEDRLEKL